LTNVLRALPADTGMAFVLVQHLSPTRESVLAEILSRTTTMAVTEAVDRQLVVRNHVYVIPPDRNMVIDRGRLRLQPRALDVIHHPIDSFFRSLAKQQGALSIGIVLSGTASDGTLGLEEIKAVGGTTFAQDDSANHAGMPENAVASGCVDFVLSPALIAAEIARIAKRPQVRTRPSRGRAKVAERGESLAKESLMPVLQKLHAATGVDFSQYKSSTLLRRVSRRMSMAKARSFEAYAKIVETSPEEAEALYQDILINVTRFFRDPEVFELLRKKFLPALIRGRSPDDPIRVWVAGCSTGQEAYSLAMILIEALETAKAKVSLQIIATDLNAAAIAQARSGAYSAQQLRDVAPRRVQRFFVEKNGVFTVRKELRELCLFSRHHVLTDPPLSHMDLVCCRNLLIYLEPALQRTVIPLLHYALKPAGLLVLGASETVGQGAGLFHCEARKQKIYRKISGSGRVPILAPTNDRASFPVSIPRASATPLRAAALPVSEPQHSAATLLAALAPPAVLVSGSFDIIEFYGDTGAYLAPTRGKATHALLRMVREELQAPLHVLLHRVKKDQQPGRAEGVRFRSTRGLQRVNLRVVPVPGSPARDACFLVIFEDAVDSPQGSRGVRNRAGKAGEEPSATKIERLENEVASMRGYLQDLTEQYRNANEELQASNEEAQSTNEEFQSVNEELETSKEEIQASNEELTTINDELSQRNLDLARISADLSNLIQSVQVAIVIVSVDLRIRRFSPIAEKILNIRASDVGRPLSEIRMNLVHPELDAMLNDVISSRSARDCEVETKDGQWYSLRVQPYFASGSKIDGAVLSMINITAIRSAREYAESIVATVREPLLVLDDQLRVRSASRSFYEVFGVTQADTEGVLLYDLGAHEWDLPVLRRLLGSVLSNGTAVNDFEMEHEFRNLGLRTLLVNARRLADPIKGQQSVLLSIEDITQRKRQAEELVRRNAELAANDAAKNHFLAVLSHELRSPLNVIRLWSQLLLRPGTSEASLRQGLSIIDRSSRTQARLVDDLLDVHRIASGKLRLDLAEVNLADVLRTVLDAMEPVAAQKGIRLDRDIDLAPAFMMCDAIRLQQVFGNVIENAIKFTPPSGEVVVSLRRVLGHAEVRVSDTGIGLEAEEIPRIFESFRAADPLTSRSHGGLGLGLSIAKQLVALHRGAITAASAGRGKGLTVNISLPLLMGQRAAISPLLIEKGVELERLLPLRGLSVLIVDDEADAREALNLILASAGAHSSVVSSTEEALAAIARQAPSIILSDIGMPGRDGYDLIRSVRALPPEQGGRIPAIAVTAYAALEDRELALSAGFQLHLAKPLDPARLIATIVLLMDQQLSPPATVSPSA